MANNSHLTTDKINHIRQLIKDGKLDEAILRLEAMLETYHEDVGQAELYSLLCKLYTRAGRKSDIQQDWIKKAKEISPTLETQPQSIEVTLAKQTRRITEVRIKKSGEVIKINTTHPGNPKATILIPAQLNRLFHTINLIPPNFRILDVGCGDGWLPRFLYHLKPEQEIVGVDIEEDLIKFARKRHPKDIKFCLPNELKGKFNMILMCEVLEHIENPEDLISTYIPYLEKNAIFIISVPSPKFGYCPGHIHQYLTKQDWESMLSKFTQNIEWCDNPNLPTWYFLRFNLGIEGTIKRFKNRTESVATIPDIFENSTMLYIGANKLRTQLTDLFENRCSNMTIDVLEIWHENVKYLRGLKKFNGVMQGDVREIDKLFKPNSYDIVMWWHGPEHIEIQELAKTLDKLKRVAKKLVILGCPWGIYVQGEEYGNPYEKHISHLTLDFFKNHGFLTSVVGTRDIPGSNITAWWKKDEKRSK